MVGGGVPSSWAGAANDISDSLLVVGSLAAFALIVRCAVILPGASSARNPCEVTADNLSSGLSEIALGDVFMTLNTLCARQDARSG